MTDGLNLDDLYNLSDRELLIKIVQEMVVSNGHKSILSRIDHLENFVKPLIWSVTLLGGATLLYFFNLLVNRP